MSPARNIARILLDLKAVTLSPRKPFTWASGLSAPLYCDNRLIISSVSARDQVIQAFCDTITQQQWQADAIAGTATAGIPHAAWIADRLQLPMVYVRDSAKKHGRQNRIEGRLPEKAKVVVVEDLISTGGSCIRAAEALHQVDAEVSGVVAVFQYGLAKATTNFQKADLPYTTLSNLDALLAEALDSGYISAEEQQMVQDWRRDPQAWSEAQS